MSIYGKILPNFKSADLVYNKNFCEQAMVKEKHIYSYQTDGTIDFKQWLENVKIQYALIDTELLNAAFVIYKKIQQPTLPLERALKTAEIILDLQLGQEAASVAIIACASFSMNDMESVIKKEFNSATYKLISTIHQMEIITKNRNDENRSIDKICKMLLAMANDIRAVIIKLAERLTFMQSIKNLPQQERQLYAKEIFDIYAPLANQLGIGRLKWELEDIAFRYSDPMTYKHIASLLVEKRDAREKRISLLIADLENKLNEQNITCTVTGRAKHIYSIFSKMNRKSLSYDSIYDHLAIRILTDRVQDCYQVLSLVHHFWQPLSDEFDDYISNPKANGYRSIHTAVIGDNNQFFEIQIRTHDMHKEAENGIAAHWIYKENQAKSFDDAIKITYLRQLLNWHQNIGNVETTDHHLTSPFFDNKIYVMTPKGDIIDLPSGATPIDFAYHVHTDLGHHCRGAKVNGQIVPLNTPLRTSDKIEIYSVVEGGPSRDWLNVSRGYVKSQTTRKKIQAWFKRQQINEESTENTSTRLHQKIEKKTPIKTMNVVQNDVHINAQNVIADSAYLLMRFAKCCKPISGDPIIGYITQGRGISVHKKNCSNIKNTQYQYRLIEINWKDNAMKPAFA